MARLGIGNAALAMGIMALWASYVAAAPEIAILGTNGVAISDGDSVPAVTDGSYFASCMVSAGSVDRVFVVTNSGTTSLSITGIVFSGVAAGDFAVLASPVSVNARSGSNLTLRFDPTASGLRDATITVYNDDSDEGVYDFTVRGSGIVNPFRVTPYLQNPSASGMSILWMAEFSDPAWLEIGMAGGNTTLVASVSILATNLNYDSSEYSKFSANIPPSIPYQHQVRVTNLIAGATYWYRVTQNAFVYSNSFHTAPGETAPVRFVVYADSETEPESTGTRVTWDNPAGGSGRLYLVDQTTGYASNVAAMKARAPDFVMITGDLTESGGEQRDWDEFWRHNAGALNDLAGSRPILAAIGNHEYYGGTAGGYNQPFSERAVSKYLTYFQNPPNKAGTAEQQERFFRIDYGPVTVIFLDACNGNDSVAGQDTSLLLSTATGCRSPDFNPGSVQYQWLQAQLADAQTRSLFTFVGFHHIPYSSGPHGAASEQQSGVPVRVLTPLFFHYGVDAVLCGHDEMVERSELSGNEIMPGGGTNAYTLHFLDYGVGGDGLRAPTAGVLNPQQVFLAHVDSPEVWNGSVLVDGGKHYGHLEVNVTTNNAGQWTAKLSPVYVFPNMASNGTLIKFDRRIYPDEITLLANEAVTTTSLGSTSTSTTTDSTSTSSSTTSTTSTSSSSTSAAPGDQDGDSLPDWWEQQYGLDLNTSNAANANADGDAHSDWEEYIADTDPGSTSSVFHASSVGGQDGFNLAVTPSSTNRLYNVYWTSNLGPGAMPWSPTDFDQPGNGSNLTFSLTNSGANGFYWPSVRLP